MEMDIEKNLKDPKEQIVEFLNQAVLAKTTDEKLTCLTRVQDLILHHGPELLDSFLDEVLAFQNDRNQEIRRLIVGFLEDACKSEPDVFPKVAVNISFLLRDEAVAVQKRVIQALTHLYPVVLRWLSRAKSITKDMSSAWDWLVRMKGEVIKWLDHDNDGVRTLTIKFYEMVIICQTYRDEESASKESEFSLDAVPPRLKIVRPRKLEDEANKLMADLVKFHGSMHISSANLLACMGTLSLIARARPMFMGQVISAMEMLHANLPPTLTKSQVSSVRKHLKLQLLNLLKHPTAIDYLTNITTLLTDLGATQSEVEKCMPKPSDIQRRKQRVPPTPKRTKPDFDDDDDEFLAPKLKSKRAVDPIDYTQKFVKERLSPHVAAEMVIKAMVRLPDSMPPHFSSSYTPIAAAGTEGQIYHVARLLAAQLSAAGLGIDPPKDIDKNLDIWEEDDDDMKSTVSSFLGVDTKKSSLSHLVPAGGIPQAPSKTLKSMKLSEITKPLSAEAKTKIVSGSIIRMYRGEKMLLNVGASNLRNTLVAKMSSLFPDMMHDSLIAFISEDLRIRLDVALSWLYELYSTIMGFFTHASPSSRAFDAYNNVFGRIAGTLIVRNDLKDRDQLLTRLYLEAPMLPEGSVDFLRRQAMSEQCSQAAIDLLKQLVIYRPGRQINYFNALLELSTARKSEVKRQSLNAVMGLYEKGEMQQVTEDYAVMYLNFLSLKEPPEIVIGDEEGEEPTNQWNEQLAKTCLFLFSALLERDHSRIHELAKIFANAVPDVKRTILKNLDVPLKSMDMESPQLFKLLETCPEGTETFITKVLHVVTERAHPSPILVEKVREAYKERASDVRFLIPILGSLPKFEILNILPKLVKLTQAALKEVFSRLLTNSIDGLPGPLTPVELLVNLHAIDASKCDVKSLMKSITLCVEDTNTFTSEVIAIVINQLVEQSAMPTLLMRTILQALSLHPKLTGFVLNILQKLLVKQVWKNKVLWEGFIKCCEKTQPQSFSILLQLSPSQIGQLLTMCPSIREPMYSHVMQFPDSQRAHIPNSVVMMLYGAPVDEALQMKDELSNYVIKSEVHEMLEETTDLQSQSYEYDCELTVPGEDAPPGT